MMNADFAGYVEAVNAANRLANEWHPKLWEVFKPFVGQKVSGLTILLTKQVKKVMPKLPDTAENDVRLSSSSKSLEFIARSCVIVRHSGFTGGFAQYFSTPFTVGELSDYVLVKLNDPITDRVTNYTVEWVEYQRQKVKDLKKVYDVARMELEPFSER